LRSQAVFGSAAPVLLKSIFFPACLVRFGLDDFRLAWSVLGWTGCWCPILGSKKAQNPQYCLCCCCALLQVAGFNYQLAYSSQNPVTALPPSEAGFCDVFGSAWEWAEDHFAAFPGACVACMHVAAERHCVAIA